MKVWKQLISLGIILCLMGSAMVFADPVAEAAAEIGLSDQTVMEGATFYINLSVAGASEAVTGGTFSYTKAVANPSVPLTWGDPVGQNGATVENPTPTSVDFVLDPAATLAEDTILVRIPVTVGDLDGNTKTPVDVINLMEGTVLQMGDAEEIPLTFDPGVQTITVIGKDAKVSLLNPINSVSDFDVTYTADDVTIHTELTPTADKRGFYVSIVEGEQELLIDGTQYTVTVSGDGYWKKSVTTFTYGEDTNIAYTIDDFYAGDVVTTTGWAGINVFDFNFLCTRIGATAENRLDLNRDGAITAADIACLIDSWSAIYDAEKGAE